MAQPFRVKQKSPLLQLGVGFLAGKVQQKQQKAKLSLESRKLDIQEAYYKGEISSKKAQLKWDTLDKQMDRLKELHESREESLSAHADRMFKIKEKEKDRALSRDLTNLSSALRTEEATVKQALETEEERRVFKRAAPFRREEAIDQLVDRRNKEALIEYRKADTALRIELTSTSQKKFDWTRGMDMLTLWQDASQFEATLKSKEFMARLKSSLETHGDDLKDWENKLIGMYINTAGLAISSTDPNAREAFAKIAMMSAKPAMERLNLRIKAAGGTPVPPAELNIRRKRIPFTNIPALGRGKEIVIEEGEITYPAPAPALAPAPEPIRPTLKTQESAFDATYEAIKDIIRDEGKEKGKLIFRTMMQSNPNPNITKEQMKKLEKLVGIKWGPPLSAGEPVR